MLHESEATPDFSLQRSIAQESGTSASWHRLRKEEILQLTALLAREIPADNLEDDLITLLWEANFSSITYQLAAAPVAGQTSSEFPDTGGPGGWGEGERSPR